MSTPATKRMPALNAGHRNIHADLRRSDPRRADSLKERIAAAWDGALPSGKRSAALMGVSPQTVSDYRTKGAGALLRFNLQIDALSADPDAHPERLIVECEVTYQRSLMPLSDDQLIVRFWDLTRAEAAAEAGLNEAQQMYAVTGDLRALASAAKVVAANAKAIAAVAEEIAERPGCPDPRTWGRA